MTSCRVATALLFAALVATALPAQAPQSTVITHPGATYAPVPNVTFGGDAALTYRFAWAIAESADSAGQVTPGFAAPARVLNTLVADGVPRDRIHLAIVARGPAAVDMLDNEAYRAIKGRDNPNLPILRLLAAQGVRLIVCGQTMVGRKLPRDGFPSFVLVSRAATVAQARLAAEGFTFNPF
ncbi:MAG: DsrE family protein [Gemmatimonadaceae bacterium]|nr:DsrE family protein [Gemmatimonadaceae bacterium]